MYIPKARDKCLDIHLSIRVIQVSLKCFESFSCAFLVVNFLLMKLLILLSRFQQTTNCWISSVVVVMGTFVSSELQLKMVLVTIVSVTNMKALLWAHFLSRKAKILRLLGWSQGMMCKERKKSYIFNDIIDYRYMKWSSLSSTLWLINLYMQIWTYFLLLVSSWSVTFFFP